MVQKDASRDSLQSAQNHVLKLNIGFPRILKKLQQFYTNTFLTTLPCIYNVPFLKVALRHVQLYMYVVLDYPGTGTTVVLNLVQHTLPDATYCSIHTAAPS